MSSNSTPDPHLTDAEWDTIKVIWAKQPCPAGVVQDALANTRGWAYSTVKTILDRMVEKGLLSVKRDGKRQLFTATIERETVRRREVKRVLSRAFDGALSPALRLLLEDGQLDPAEAADLRDLIDRACPPNPDHKKS
jgi:BlaI family penicillinase repressor